MRTLIDSDILVDHLRGHNRFDPGDDEIFVSSITRAELFSGRATDEARVIRLLEAMHELSVDRAVAELATAVGALRPIARETTSLIVAQEVERALRQLVDGGPAAIARARKR